MRDADQDEAAGPRPHRSAWIGLLLDDCKALTERARILDDALAAADDARAALKVKQAR